MTLRQSSRQASQAWVAGTLKKAMTATIVMLIAACVVLPLIGSASAHAADRASVGAGTDSTEGLTTVFNYLNFSDISALTLNGNAQQASGFYLLVTPAATNQAGSIWYNNQVNVAQGFTTNFTFRFGPTNRSSSPADGIAFVIQNSALSALGTNGAYLAYTGIPNSLAVEFDTFYNSGLSDPDGNHVGIQSCGMVANTADHGGTCNLGLQPNLPVTLADGKGHRVVIRYSPGAPGMSGILTISIDKQVVLTGMVNLSTLLSLNGNDAWVGFTGGTGLDFESQAIRTWEFSSVGTASSE